MNRFYNLKEQKRSTKNLFLHFLTYSLTKILPFFSYKLCLKFFCSPKSRRDYEFRTKLQPQVFPIDTLTSQIKLFRFGNGEKHILLVHGWADSTRRFTQLIDHFLKSGEYSIWSLDHIGHGKSEGNTGHLPGFIDGIESCLNFINESGFKIDTFIAHSMGGLALMNQDNTRISESKKIIISSPSKFFEYMFLRITSLGFSVYTLEHFLKSLSKKYNKEWSSLSPDIQLKKTDSSFLFIHDKDDDVCSFKNLDNILLSLEKQDYKNLLLKALDI